MSKLIINIPDFRQLEIKHIICDFNGTIANNGKLIKGVKDRINKLSEIVQVHVITADTFGSVKTELEGVNCKLAIISATNQADEKLNYLKSCGKDNSVCIGNGKNDKLMLSEASIGIALLQDEGAFTGTVFSSDILSKNINDALDLFLIPKRIIATMRN